MNEAAQSKAIVDAPTPTPAPATDAVRVSVDAAKLAGMIDRFVRETHGFCMSTGASIGENDRVRVKLQVVEIDEDEDDSPTRDQWRCVTFAALSAPASPAPVANPDGLREEITKAIAGLRPTLIVVGQHRIGVTLACLCCTAEWHVGHTESHHPNCPLAILAALAAAPDARSTKE